MTVKMDKKMKSEIYSKLYNEFVRVIPKEKIYTDELNRLAYGTDASFYRLIPEIVVKVKSALNNLPQVSDLDNLNFSLLLLSTYYSQPVGWVQREYSREINVDLGDKYYELERVISRRRA